MATNVKTQSNKYFAMETLCTSSSKSLHEKTQPEVIFFDPKGKKLKNLTFLGEIFQIQTQTISG